MSPPSTSPIESSSTSSAPEAAVKEPRARRIRVLLGVLLALPLLDACTEGSEKSFSDIFTAPVGVRGLDDVDFSSESEIANWDYPDVPLGPGRILRVIWLNSGEAAPFSKFLAGLEPVVSGAVKVEINTELPQQLRRDAGTGNILGPGPVAVKLEALTLSGRPELVDEVTDVLTGIQKSIPQVDISVRVVEVLETDTFSFGLDTGFSSREKDPDSPTETFFNSATTLLGLPEIPGRGGSFSPGSGTTPLAISLGTLTKGLQVDFLIRALKLFTKTDVLSAPQLRVLDGYSAEIVAGEDIPFFTPAFNATGLATVSTGFKQVGIKLFIIPKVVGRDMVRISLTTSVEAVTRESTFVSSDVTVTNPVISTRRVSTYMDVYDGDTAVIGGLLTRSKFDSENRVPVLGEVPILNILFTSRSKQVLQTNLIFFITPRIIDPSRDRRRLITPVQPTETEETPPAEPSPSDDKK